MEKKALGRQRAMLSPPRLPVKGALLMQRHNAWLYPFNHLEAFRIMS